MRYHDHAKSVADGIVDAWKTYNSWSGKVYVHDEGIEQFLSVKVAQSLHEKFLDTCHVRLEVRVADLAYDSGAAETKGQIPKKLRSGGRVDVAFFDRKNWPKGVVEIKRHMNGSIHRSDAQRIKRMLERLGAEKDGSLQWGAVAAMHTIWRSNRKTPEQRAQTALESIQSEVAPFRVSLSISTYRVADPIEVDDDAFFGCAGICFLIHK